MMSKNQSINEQKRAVATASRGLYANRTLLTEMNTWAASVTFIFEQGVNLICSWKVLARCVKEHSLSS